MMAPEQLDLLVYMEEREAVLRANARREGGRGYVVFATDPHVPVESSEYRWIFATEASSPAQAVRKVQPQASARRLRAFLGTGRFKREYAEARWID